MRMLRAALTPLLVGVVATTLAACGEVTYKDVLSHAESHLYYPDSRVVSTAGAGERSGLDTGTMPAGTTVTLAVTAPMATIYGWYESQLASRGWTLRKTETINGGYELFTKGAREVFKVSPGRDDGTYAISYSILPAHCATQDPIPIDRIGNC